MPEVKVNTAAGSFNCYEAGNGPVLLLLHGLISSHRVFTRVLPLIEPHFRVCAPDMLGHGNSEARQDTVSVDHHAASLELLAEAAGLTTGFYLAGAGLGAAVALELAVREPQLVRGLLLLGAPAFSTPADRSAWLGSRVGAHTGGDGKAKVRSGGAVQARYSQFEASMVERINEDTARAGMWALHDVWALGAYDLVGQAAKLTVRTIAAFGDKDNFLHAQPALKQALPTAEYVVVEGAGHHISWDAPERVADLLTSLLPAS